MTKVMLVNVGHKYPKKYVQYMAAAISRNTTHKYNFEIISRSDRPGWWAKTDLFRPRTERVLYLDLDTIILKNIDILFEYQGPFCIIKDWWQPTYNSSVMSIGPGFGERIYSTWTPSCMTMFPSDQEWITSLVPKVDIWQDVAPGLIGSYKANDLKDSPKDYGIVCFHGQPKPHEIKRGWVHEAWV